MRALPARLLLLALGSGLLLSACGGTSPAVERRDALNAVIEAANDGDADAMREAVDELVLVVNRQSGKDLQAAEVARIRADAKKVRDSAALIDRDEIEKKRLAAEKAAADKKAADAAAEAERLQEEEAQRRRVEASISASAAAEASRSAAATPSPAPSQTASPTPSPTPSPSPSTGGLLPQPGDD